MATKTPATKTHAVRRGVRFRSIRQDANVLWEVTRRISTGIYEAVGVNEPYDLGNGRFMDSDYAGVTDRFLTTHIQQGLARAAVINSIVASSDAFWDTVEIGSTLHYDSSFGQYVRGTVVLNAEGKRVLLPQALVGKWPQYDLVSVGITGEPYYGYHVRQIQDGVSFQPNEGNIYEHRPERAKFDPRELTPLSWAIPEPTAEQSAAYARERLLQQITRLGADTGTDAESRLADIKALLA